MSSEEVLGADLQQLEDLAAAYDTAGTEIAAKGETLRGKINEAVVVFIATLDGLARDASTLTTAIDTEIDGVSTQAAGVQWTGTNRTAFDGDLGAFNTAVKTGTTAINTDIGTLKSDVETRFTPVLDDFATALTASAEEINVNAGTMRIAVSTQRSNLDEAANVGWTSA